MVRFSNVSFGYEKDVKILNNISFCIEFGTIFGICGPSGSGKTTLAKLICGLLKPSEGSIEVSEKPLMVLQFPERQLFGKTVIEDVMYGPMNTLKDKEKARQRAQETLKKLGIEEEVDHVYERLQALEADREFLKHCISSLRKGDKGLDLLQEILQHLRDLRSVELRVKNMGDGVL